MDNGCHQIVLYLTLFCQTKASSGIGNNAGFWDAVKANIEKVAEAKDWWNVIQSANPVVEAEDVEFIAEARKCLPEEPWTGDTWGRWTAEVKQLTGRKGRKLFMPLRKALTGLEHGPELASVLPLIGRERTLDRLS